MGAQSRKIRGCMLWLVGLIRGDGYIDNRHVEIYNSSACILRNAVKVLRTLKIPVNRIKVDIYTQKASNSSVQRWVEELNLPPQNFKLRNITSPWKPRIEKVRIRIASKKLAETLHRLLKNAKNSKFYIKGLFDAEASVDIKGYVEFKQAASESGIKLVKDVNHALRRMGIEVTEPKIKKDKRNKKKDWITGTQIAQMTGLRRQRVYEALKVLQARRIILRDGRLTGIQKDYTIWLDVTEKRYTEFVTEKRTPDTQKRYKKKRKSVTTKDKRHYTKDNNKSSF